MAILITGVAGFIGCNLAVNLVRHGNTVFGVDNFSRGRTENLSLLFPHSEFCFTKVDISDLPAYRIAFAAFHSREPITEVWHMAANSDIPAGIADASIDLRDLAGERWIIGAARGPCREAGLAACAAAGFNPDVAQRVNDWAALLRLTAADCGVALIPRLAINTGSLRGVVLRPVRGPTHPSRHIYAAVRAGAERSPMLAPVLSALQVVAAEPMRTAARPRAHHSAK